ncbi:MAG: hypothetical protein ACRD2Y_09185 [Terriglobales bacterium]
MLTILVAIAVVVLLAVSDGWLWSQLAHRRRASRIRDREPMPPDVFYETFYEASGLPREVVLKMLDDLERITGIPRTLLRPEDRLWEGESLDESVFDSLYTVELVIELEKLEEEVGEQVELSSLDTVDRYIRTLGLLERQKMMNQRPRKEA